MVGQRKVKQKREALLEAKTRGTRPSKKNKDYASEVVNGPRHWSAPPKYFKNECLVGGLH